MNNLNPKLFVMIMILISISIQPGLAGPPYMTDDPEPVEFRHWEYYISTINTFQRDISTGTLPHVEVNYGIVPNVQVHLILPMNYNDSRDHGFNVGYSYTEVGIKYRFIQEADDCPQIGTFPIVEIPTIRNSEFGNGLTQLFIPLWAQKTWGKLTTYGGAGYWINPGINNHNWLFTGWLVQYDFSKVIIPGIEVYYHTPDTVGSNSTVAFNAGGSINASDKFHIIFSVGHSLINESFTTMYFGLLWTI